MSTHWRSPKAEHQPGAEDAFAPERSAHGEIELAPIPGLPTRWDALDQPNDSEPGNGLALRNTGYEDDGYDVAGFAATPADVPFPAAAHPDSAYDDRTFADPAFTSRAFDPTFDDTTFADPAFSGGAFAGQGFSDPGFSDPVYGDAAFFDHHAAAAVVPGEYPAPLAVGAPLSSDFPVPAPIAPPSLFDDVYKACFRLTGLAALASAIATNAVALSATPAAPAGDACLAMASAVQSCIDAEYPDERRIPYYQHRARLRRDLARRPERDRAILAMRHLVGVPPSGVAARLDVPESQVREVGSAWCPDDSRVDSLALLRGIDSWISSDLGSVVGGQTGHELAHLDDGAA
jgi:hypothetical protein